MLSLLKMPCTLWLKWLLDKIIWKLKNKSLSIGYLSWFTNSSFGKNVSLQKNVIVKNSSIGDMTYISAYSNINNTKTGNFCSIGPGCRIGPGKHPTSKYVSTHPAFYSSEVQSRITFADKNYFEEYETVNIGNDVWIGANVIIVDGIKIETGAMIAAGAVVTKDVPPYAIVGGVPAKIIKYRFDTDKIKKLLKSKWWEKDYEWLRNNFKLFHDIEKFEKKVN